MEGASIKAYNVVRRARVAVPCVWSHTLAIIQFGQSGTLDGLKCAAPHDSDLDSFVPGRFKIFRFVLN